MLPQLVESFPLQGSLGRGGSVRNRAGDCGKKEGTNIVSRGGGKKKEATSGMDKNGNRDVKSNLEFQL